MQMKQAGGQMEIMDIAGYFAAMIQAYLIFEILVQRK